MWISRIFRAQRDVLENVIFRGRLQEQVEQNQVCFIINLSTEDAGDLSNLPSTLLPTIVKLTRLVAVWTFCSSLCITMDEHRHIVVLIATISGSGELEIFTVHRFLCCSSLENSSVWSLLVQASGSECDRRGYTSVFAPGVLYHSYGCS